MERIISKNKQPQSMDCTPLCFILTVYFRIFNFEFNSFVCQCKAGVSCSKAAKFSIKHFAKSKETATAVNVAATSSLNKTKTSDKNKNAVKAQTEATSRTNSSWKGGFAPVDDADFEPDDYRSSDPTPSLKQPPHKLVPSR